MEVSEKTITLSTEEIELIKKRSEEQSNNEQNATNTQQQSGEPQE